MTPAAVSAAAPTRVRYRVVAFTVSLAMITYLDRVCISKMAPDIMRDLGLSMTQMSWVFSAFTLAYGAFEIPTAWWADRVGTRRVLARIVAWWSVFTILTAGAFNYLSLLAVRFLFGAGEAGAWPCVARTFSRWIPARERGTVQGVFFMGAHLSGGITPILVTLLLTVLPWRSLFVVFGVIGFLWAYAWYRWFRDEPGEHASVNAAEAELIVSSRRHEVHSGVDWGRLFGNRNIIPLCIQYFANSYAFYFYITWLPTYLEKGRGLTSMRQAFFAGLPLTMAVAGDLFGGITTDRVAARLGLRAGRAGVGSLAYLVAGLVMLAGIASPDAEVAGVLLAVSATFIMFTLGAAWATCIDIGGPHSGVVGATMNTAGQVGGFLSPLVFSYIVEKYGSWSAPLYVLAGLFVAASLAWLFVDPKRRVFDEA
ncbi:MAG: MFS transporter [Acidobacteria bacterium]|nr:MFS transporter [Acidobacteriota bacterium]